MEDHVFTNTAVAEILNDSFIEARMHVDKQTNFQARILETQRKFANNTANPTFVLVNPKDDSEIGETAGLMRAVTFADFLREGLKRAGR